MDFLELFVEKILFLGAFHALLHPAAEIVAQGEGFILDFQGNREVFKAFAVVGFQEKRYLALGLDFQHRADMPHEFLRGIGLGHVGHCLLGQGLSAQFRIGLEDILHRLDDDIEIAARFGAAGKLGKLSPGDVLLLTDPFDSHPSAAFNENPHVAVGEFEHLNHLGQGSYGVNVFGRGLIRRSFLKHQKHFDARRCGGVQGPKGGRAPHEEGNDVMRKHHQFPQRNKGKFSLGVRP